MLSPEKLHALGIGAEWSEPLTTTFATFGMNDVNKQAAFIGQCAHECGHFKKLEENLNYSVDINSSREKLKFTLTIQRKLPIGFIQTKWEIGMNPLETDGGSTGVDVYS